MSLSPGVVDALALVASGVFLVRLLPQPVRLARHGVASGVSGLAALNGVVSAVAWLVYGLLVGLPVVWVVSVLALVPGVWQVLLLRQAITRRDVAWTGAFVVGLVAAAAVGVFVGALAFSVLVTQGPQVIEALRGHDLSGLAPATWWVAVLDAATWGAYGLAVGDAALVGYFVVLLASAVIVLARIGWTRRRRPALS